MSTSFCNYCGSGHLDFLQTGDLLATSGQWKKFHVHTSSFPAKPMNGVYLDASTGAYIQTAAKIAASGFVEVEAGGCVNAYLNLPNDIANIGISGRKTGTTSLVKAVLLNHPNETHHYPATGFLSISGCCSTCSGRVF